MKRRNFIKAVSAGLSVAILPKVLEAKETPVKGIKEWRQWMADRYYNAAPELGGYETLGRFSGSEFFAVTPIKIHVTMNHHNVDPLERTYASWRLEFNGSTYGSIMEVSDDLVYMVIKRDRKQKSTGEWYSMSRQKEINYNLVTAISKSLVDDMVYKFSQSKVINKIKPLAPKEVENQILAQLKEELSLG